MTELRIGIDFGLEVSQGNVPGYGKENKFGRTGSLTATLKDIWIGNLAAIGGPEIWIPPTAARIHQITSSSANDTAAGTGLRTLEVFGLETWDSPQSSEIVTMAGLADVATQNSYVIIHIKVGRTWGTGGVNAGDITATADVDGTITSAMEAGMNRTEMLIYGIPSTQNLQVHHLRAEITKGPGVTAIANGNIFIMPDPATNVVDNTAWINEESFLIIQNGSTWTHTFEPTYKTCIGPCIIKAQATPSVTNTTIIATLDAFIVDK